MTARLPRRLVLAGGGHAQVAVLRSLAMAPIAGSEITLINPQRETFYSGMLPGVLAGLLDPEECTLDVAALAARARIRFLEDAAVGLDTAERQIELESGRTLPFDVLSIDIEMSIFVLRILVFRFGIMSLLLKVSYNGNWM